MNITYVIEDFYVNGGVERIVSAKANSLCANGHNVSIISIYSDSRTTTYHLDRGVSLISLNVPMANHNATKLVTLISRTSTLIKASVRLNHAIDTLKPDIIFFATTLSALLLPLCKTTAKKIFESHSAKIFTPYNRLFLPMELNAYMVVCLTKDDAKEYRHAKRVEVIPNFIETPSAFVKDYGVKRAVAVGRLEEVKGFDTLINMWTEIIKQQPDWQLDIYGEGSCHQSLQEQIDNFGLNASVHLRGRTENIMHTYTNYSLHLMTSRYEGLPMTLIEAQACGLPSVTFNFEYGASDVIIPNRTGLLIPQNDTIAFIAATLKMMKDTALRQQYGVAAKAVIKKFGKEEIMKKWKDIIEEAKPL